MYTTHSNNTITYIEESGSTVFTIQYGEGMHIKTRIEAEAISCAIIALLTPPDEQEAEADEPCQKMENQPPPAMTAKEAKAKMASIANMATMIFSRNPNEFNESRAVDAARRIYKYSHDEQQ